MKKLKNKIFTLQYLLVQKFVWRCFKDVYVDTFTNKFLGKS